MQRITRFLILSVTISTLFMYILGRSISAGDISLPYFGVVQTENELVAQLISIVLAILGGAFANSLSKLLLRNYEVRKLIMGDKHVEGHWLVHTSPHSKAKSTHPMSAPAITYLKYQVDSQETTDTTTRINADGGTFVTISEVAHIRTSGPVVRYLNHFEAGGPTHQRLKGFAYGRFVSSDKFKRFPDKLEATFFVENGDDTYFQVCTRIDDKEVKRWYEDHGDNWKLEFLKNEASATS